MPMSQNTYEIQRIQHRYALVLPKMHLIAAGLTVGETVGVSITTISGQLCINVRKDPDAGITEEIRPVRDSQAQSGTVALRSSIMKMVGISNATVRYTTSRNQITGITGHQSRLSGPINLRQPNKSLLTSLNNRRDYYQVKLKDHITTAVNATDSVWMWIDTHTDGFVVCLDTDKEVAPDDSVVRSLDDYETTTTDYAVRIPGPVVRTLQIDAQSVNWGHDETRILGVVNP